MKIKFKNKLKLLLLVLVTSNLFAQESPPIEKFTTDDYGGANQNWMISQGSNKFIYVANNEGLLEYNGAKWKLYPSPNNTIIRAVRVVGERIYTGCYMEFGFWERDKLGKLVYQSLVPKLKKRMIEDEHIWNIITYDEWILFQSLNRIYFYSTITQEYSIVNSKNLISMVFNIKNVIYYHVMNEGIYTIKEGKPKLINDDSILKKNKVFSMFSIPNGLLLQTKGFGFYTLINNDLSEWNISTNENLKKMNVFNSTQLEDKSFVLGTIKNGVIFLTNEGNISYQIDRSNGLGNSTALSIFQDIDKNIWVGLDNGISCINVNSPVKVFNDDEGKIGVVYTSALLNNYLYIGTNQGLFYKKVDAQEPFKFINGTAGQIWSLFPYKDELLCGHHAGTFVVKNDKAVLISNNPGTWGFKPIPNMENTLLEGNYNGLNILTKIDGNWRLRNKVKGFDNSARYFEISNDNEVWISHGYKGVFRLKVDKNFTTVNEIIKDSTISIGKNSSLISFRNRILYANEQGIFVLNNINNRFVKDTILSSIISDAEYISGKLIADETQKLWAFSSDNISYVVVNDLTTKFNIKKIPIQAHLRKGQIGYENISYLKNNKYLLGTRDGYLMLDISKINEVRDYNIVLNSIELKKVGAKTRDIDITSSGEFKYTYNSIVFNYSVPEYNKYKTVKFQYKLTGLYDKWSDWTDKSELVFDNLAFGNYNIKIHAKIGNKITSNIISYNFKINRPWYLSNIAIIIYFIFLIGITFFIHKAYKRYFKKQHEHKQLESEQLIIRIKNEKLNEAMDSKNRELAISTMSIIKKNEVLSSIKKELKNTLISNNDIVIKLIDNNINNKKDWKFFEEAFNNVDKDFLEKVKNKYPEMTPNDIRFCAYLRLNLTSKEIAPLLNISLRSVETRRYRLRKRMGLSHDAGLIDHILKI